MVVTNPGMKPCSLRVDQLDRDTDECIKKMATGDRSNSPKRSNSRDRQVHTKDSLKARKEDLTKGNDELEKIETEKLGSRTSNDHSSEKSVPDGETRLPSANPENAVDKFYPEIVHFGIRPPQLSYAGNPE